MIAYKALEEGITSAKQTIYNQNKNAGYGLYAMKKILKKTGGQFVIISNNTIVKMINGHIIILLKLSSKWNDIIVAFKLLLNLGHLYKFYTQRLYAK